MNKSLESLVLGIVLATGLGCGGQYSAKFENVQTSVGDARSTMPAASRNECAAPADAPMIQPMPHRDIEPSQAVPAPQAGVLTAGSVDDHERFADYQNYLNSANYTVPAGFRAFNPGMRAEIELTDSWGQPLGDVQVTVQELKRRGNLQETGRTLAELRTGTDGRAVFASNVDAGGSSPNAEVLLTFRPADGSPPVSVPQRLDASPWRHILLNIASHRPQQLDVALVIDTTGSMGDELSYLKAEIAGISQQIRELYPNVDQRFSLVAYRDQGDQYVTRPFDFTSSLEHFQQSLSAQRAVGGGDHPEAVHSALEIASQLSWRKTSTARVLFLVADAPPHERHAQRSLKAIQQLRTAGVRVYPVGASGVSDTAEYVFRSMAFLTGGDYLFLTDHSGVGLAHAEPQVSEYAVERLDQQLLRVLASELTGRSLTPSEVLTYDGPQARHRSPDLATHDDWTPPRWLVLVAALLSIGVIDSFSRKGDA